MDKTYIMSKLPYGLQYLAANIEAMRLKNLRYGKHYDEYLEVFKKGNSYKINPIPIEVIKELIENIPFYKDYNIMSFEDLPIVNKEIIKENPSRFINKHVEPYTYLNTGGTTGSAFVFPVTKEIVEKKFASAWYFRELHGLYREENNANIIGRQFLSIKKKNKPYWIWSHPTNQLLLSQYHLERSSVKEYLYALKRYKILWLHAYPSTLYYFSQLVVECGLLEEAKKLKLKGITVSSETLTQRQREMIECTFDCRVFNFYGQAEGVADIFENEKGLLQVNEDFSYVELLHYKDNLYRVVGTQLGNECLPLLRYDTGDLVELYTKKELENLNIQRSGRLIKKILGRKEDYIYLKDGRKVGRLDHLFKNMINIIEVQIIQKQKGNATFLIVKGKNYSSQDEEELKQEVYIKFSNLLSIKVEYVDKIPKTKLGKLKQVICNIQENENT